MSNNDSDSNKRTVEEININDSISNYGSSNMILHSEDASKAIHYLQNIKGQQGLYNTGFLNNINLDPPDHHIHFNTPQFNGMINMTRTNSYSTFDNFNLNLNENNTTSPGLNFHNPFLSNEHVNGNFTPPVYINSNDYFSPILNPYNDRYWSLPNSGNINMINNINFSMDFPLIDPIRDNEIINIEILNNVQDNLLNQVQSRSNVNNEDRVNLIYDESANIEEEKVNNDIKKKKVIFTPLNLIGSYNGVGRGLNNDDSPNVFEPFKTTPLPSSKLKVFIPPPNSINDNSLRTIIEKDDLNNNNNSGIDIIMNKMYRDTFFDKVPDFTEQNKNNKRNKLSNIKGRKLNIKSPVTMPFGLDLEKTKDKPSSKSNYQLIVEGNTAALGLNYTPGFEQMIKKKRMHHQASEQKRRAALTAMFKEVADTLNQYYTDERNMSQSAILSNAHKLITKQERMLKLKQEMLTKLREKFNIKQTISSLNSKLTQNQD